MKPHTIGALESRYQSATKGCVEVDVIVRTDPWAPLYEEALNVARTRMVVPDHPKQPYIIDAEYLVAMKMVAGRPKDEEDVIFLLQQDDFNFSQCEVIIRRHLGEYGVKELRQYRAMAEWRKQRGDS
jgi:hypothetical protein